MAVLGAFGTPANRRVAAGMVGALATIILVPPGTLGGGVLGELGPTGIAVAWLLLLTVMAHRPLRFPRYFILFLGLTWLAILAGLATNSTTIPTIATALLVSASALAAGTMNTDERRFTSNAFVAIATLQALLCAFEAWGRRELLFGVATHGPNSITGGVRAEATLGHPLVAGLVLLVACAIVLRSPWSARIKIALASVLGAGVVASGSSSPLIVFLVLILWGISASGTALARILTVTALVTALTWIASFTSIASELASEVSGVNAAHRLNSLLAFPRLFSLRDLSEASFGSGWGSIARLYDTNVLINDGFLAIDNQFTTTTAVGGLLGLTLLLAFLTLVLLRSNRQYRLAAVSLIVMFLSFDVLYSPVSSVVFVVVMAFSIAPSDTRTSSSSDKVAESALVTKRRNL